GPDAAAARDGERAEDAGVSSVGRVVRLFGVHHRPLLCDPHGRPLSWGQTVGQEDPGDLPGDSGANGTTLVVAGPGRVSGSAEPLSGRLGELFLSGNGGAGLSTGAKALVFSAPSLVGCEGSRAGCANLFLPPPPAPHR